MVLVGSEGLWHRTRMIRLNCYLLVLAGGLAAASGCRSSKSNVVQPMPDSALRAIFAKAQDPRRYWLTPYGSEEGTYFANAHRVHPEQVVERAFISPKNSLSPVLAVQTVRDNEYPALLDSSSRDNWIGPWGAQVMEAVPLGPPAYESLPEHVLEPVKGYACLLPKVRMDTLHMENAIFYLRAAYGPLGFLARSDQKPAPIAVLGTAFMQSFSFIRLNYRERKALFSSTATFAPSPERLLAAVPLKTVQGALAVEGSLDGEPATIILDTAGDYEIAVAEPSGTPVRLSLGDLVYPRTAPMAARDQALGLPDHPRAGARLLAKYIVTFAPKDKMVYFERP